MRQQILPRGLADTMLETQRPTEAGVDCISVENSLPDGESNMPDAHCPLEETLPDGQGNMHPPESMAAAATREAKTTSPAATGVGQTVSQVPKSVDGMTRNEPAAAWARYMRTFVPSRKNKKDRCLSEIIDQMTAEQKSLWFSNVGEQG